MEFVYLKKVQSEHGERLLPYGTPDEIALLKARTLLFILAERRLLDTAYMNGMIFYSPKKDLAIKSIVVPGVNAYEDDVRVIIPILPFKQIWEQPGVAYVLGGGLENQTLFTSYLMSSKRWLDAHPGLQDNIESKLLEVAS